VSVCGTVLLLNVISFPGNSNHAFKFHKLNTIKKLR